MLPITAKYAGIKRIVQNLRAADTRFDRAVSRGLRKGGLLIQRESQLEVPVDYGFLKASAFTRSVGGLGFKTKIIVGYTSLYAAFVHERVKMSWRGRPRDASLRKGLEGGDVYRDSKGRYRESGTKKFVKGANRGRYWDPIPRAKAKFLEDPVYRLRNQVQLIVRDEAFLSKWR